VVRVARFLALSRMAAMIHTPLYAGAAKMGSFLMPGYGVSLVSVTDLSKKILRGMHPAIS